MDQKKIKHQKSRLTEQGILNLLEGYKRSGITAVIFVRSTI